MNVRSAAAVILVASFTFPAFGRDIPPALLAHEAKLRPTLTPARKARLSGLESQVTPKTSVHDVLALANANGVSGDDLFLLMIDYQKMLNKEARDDRKMAQEDKKLASQSKAEKLAQDTRTIDENMREAEERATRLMNAATTSLAIGVVSGSAQLAAGAKPTPTPHAPRATPK